MQDIQNIGSGTLHLAVGVYDGIIESMSILCDNIAEASIKLIEHKYG